MSSWRVRAAVVDENGQPREIPLDEATPETIRLASILHGRDISAADYYAIMEGFKGLDTLGQSL